MYSNRKTAEEIEVNNEIDRRINSGNGCSSRMLSSGMLRRVALVKTDVSD
jgi:hypothetical protein